MVKPLNKEWELFGRRYRVPGAKGDKVDCNACQKQVSAAVNRLQSHLRVCPARASLSVSLLGLQHQPHAHAARSDAAVAAAPAAPAALGDASVGLGDAPGLGDAALAAVVAASLPASAPSSTSASALSAVNATTLHAANAAIAAATGLYNDALPPGKKPRLSPSRAPRDRPVRLSPSTSIDDLLLSGLSPPPPHATANSAVYAKKRLEIEEKRLELELKRDKREARREQLQLEILEAQARKERILADKEAYEARVLLALSRKQLRDQGVSEEELDRILPVSPRGASGATSLGASSASQSTATTVPTLPGIHDDSSPSPEGDETQGSAVNGVAAVDRPSHAAEC